MENLLFLGVPILKHIRVLLSLHEHVALSLCNGPSKMILLGFQNICGHSGLWEYLLVFSYFKIFVTSCLLP